MRNAEAEARPQNRDRDDDQADQPQPILPGVEHDRAAADADDDGDERAHFQHAIRARELAIGQRLGQDAVLGWTEKGGLQRDQEQHHVCQLEVPHEERIQPQACRHDLQ